MLSREDKYRLLRIAKRPRRGPFNSIIDPAGSAPIVELSQAVKDSGGYDPWGGEEQGEQEEVKDGLETVMKKKIKVGLLWDSFRMFWNANTHAHSRLPV
jgi:nucleolar protein 53